MSVTIHEIAEDEIPALGDALPLWKTLRQDPNQHLLGAYWGGSLVLACTLAVILNLTRGMRPYAFIENVVTHPDYRRRGLGTALLKHALSAAWEQNCYKAMLLTGSKNEETLRFYEHAGFQRGVKTGFVARPDN